jgi:hypothetical protein
LIKYKIPLAKSIKGFEVIDLIQCKRLPVIPSQGVVGDGKGPKVLRGKKGQFFKKSG